MESLTPRTRVEQTPGDSEEQEACCATVHVVAELDTTQQLNNNMLNIR